MEQTTSDGATAVIAACQKGNAEQLKHLLDEGAAVTGRDESGKTALHHCADNLETQCAEMLLAADRRILDSKDEQGYTPMMLAVLAGNTNLLRLLIDKGADIDCEDNEGHKLAHWVAVCGHLKVLQILIDNKADMTSADSHHAYPIHYASQVNVNNSGNVDPKVSEKVLRKLLECDVPMDVVDDAGRQPLLWAACSGNADLCKLLIKAGADVNATDNDGLSALHCAASRGHHECIEILRKNGADCNMTDRNRCTPLFYAITLGNKECTKCLLKAGANPNHVDERGRNPSHCAAIKGCLDTIKLLEKEKADLWMQNKKGDYPIHEAAQKGHLDVVRYLLRQRNEPDAVNVQNEAGKTLLHISAAMNNLPLCKLLINHECDKNALMKHAGKEFTPYDLAVLKGHKDTADYLKSKGALPYSDLSNVEKRDSKSARSRSKTGVATVPEEENTEKGAGKRKGSGKSPDKGRTPSPKKDLKSPTSPSGRRDSKTPDAQRKKSVTSASKESLRGRSPSPSKKGKALAAGAAVGAAATGVKKDTKEERDGSQKSPDKTKSPLKGTDSTSPSKESVKKSEESLTKTKSPTKTPVKEKDNQAKEVSKEKDSSPVKGSPSKSADHPTGDKDSQSPKSVDKTVALADSEPDGKASPKKSDGKASKADSDTSKDGRTSTVDVAVGVDKTAVGVNTEKREPKSDSLAKTSTAKDTKSRSSDSTVPREDGIRSSKEVIQEAEQETPESGTQTDPLFHRNTSTQKDQISMGSTPSQPGTKPQAGEPTKGTANHVGHPTAGTSKGRQQDPKSKGKLVGFGKEDTFVTDDEDANVYKHKGKRKHVDNHNNMNKLIDSIRDSVKLYQNRRSQSRQLHQLKRAQIYTGPMHDILMFSKLMDTYRRGGGGGGDTDDEDPDLRPHASWEGYLQDQLKFVSHLYEESRPSPVSETAKKSPRKVVTESERERQKKQEMDKEMEKLAKRTADMFDSVNSDADQSLMTAKTKNNALKGGTGKPRDPATIPLEESKTDLNLFGEGGQQRREKLKSSQKRRDEEMRRRLLQAYRPYFPEDVFHSKQVCISGNRVKSAGRGPRVDMTPSPRTARKKPTSSATSRPLSHKSDSTINNSSVAQYKLREEKTQVQMTPFGLRRIRNQERPSYANWSRKYDGNIRPRTGLVFVEPRVYGELLREEQEAKERISAEGAHQQQKLMRSLTQDSGFQNGHVQNGHSTEEIKQS